MVDRIVQSEYPDDCKTHLVNEVKDAIKRQTYTSRDLVAANLNEIPIENGIYNFQTQLVEPFSHEKIFLTKHPIKEFKEDFIDLNQIDTFLEQIAANQEDILLLKEIAGYCFYRRTPFQNFFMLVGKGSNGKSVYLDLLKEMLGQKNISTMTLQTLSEGGFDIGYLYNKNANLIGDLPKKAFQDVGHLKELTGGDTITAKQKFKEPIKFKNFAKLISACNEVPETPDTTDGFFRRAVLINFPNSFEGRENRNLLNELSQPEYLWNFFKSCMDSFKMALEANNFIRVENIEMKKDKYMIYSNSAIAFCYAKLEFDPEEVLPSEEIFSKYIQYCKDNRCAAKDEIRFFKSLYLHFGNKVWKKRIVENYGDKQTRRYVIVGVFFK